MLCEYESTIAERKAIWYGYTIFEHVHLLIVYIDAVDIWKDGGKRKCLVSNFTY